MQELSIEGVANHDDPKPSGVAREAAPEALAGAHAVRLPLKRWQGHTP